MEYLYRKIFMVAVLCCIGVSLQAQDPSYSQFYAHRLYLNPGFTGTQYGLTTGLHFRNQWNSVPGSFTSYSVWADLQEPYISSGFGIMLMRDQEGAGSLVTQGAGLSYAYILRISDAFNVNIGVRTAYWQKFVDWNKFVFSDQINALDGITNGTAAQNPIERAQYVDFDAGLVARFQTPLGRNEMNSNIGFAVSHLAEPEESLQFIGTKIPRKFTAHLGTMIPISFFKKFNRRLFYLSPNFKAEYQGGIQIYSYGVYMVSHPIYIGGLYQNRTASFDLENTNFVTMIAGLEFNLDKHTVMNIGYSFDMSMTGLSTRARGVHEISMKINFDQVSMFGMPGGSYSGKRRGRSSRRSKRGRCYQFKGRDAVNLF